MNKKTLFKGIALTNFVVLMTLFLLYRNGSLEDYFHTEPEITITSSNGGTPAKTAEIVPQQKYDSVKFERLSSSKTIILVDHLKNKPVEFKADSTIPAEQKRIFYGSKSGIIVEPKVFATDSVKNLYDKYKTKQQK
jgi:hypothetical protein